jgi:hypothetical protein
MKGLGNAKMFSKPFFKLYNKMKINNLRRLLHKAYCLLPIAYCLLLIATTPSVLTAQGTVYGIKGGLAVGNQSFNNGGTTSNGLLFRPYGDLLIESAPADNSSVMYLQVGYHPRGHAKRFNGTYIDPITNQSIGSFTQEFVFHNVGLTVGFKKRNVLNNPNAYYLLGLRGEYTVSDNLFDASAAGGGVFALYGLSSTFVNKFVYGFSLGGGYEFAFSDLTGGFVEFSVHPDIGRQYFQPAIGNIFDRYSGQNVTIPEQSIRNLSFEITVGFRFLRKIEYID